MTKPYVIIGALLATILPWLRGGREPLGLLLVYGGLLIAGFLIWRLPVAGDQKSETRSQKSKAKSGLWSSGSWILDVRFWAAGLVFWSVFSLIWSVNQYQTAAWLVQLGLAVAAFSAVKRLPTDVIERLISGYLLAAIGFSLIGFSLYLTQSYERLTSTFYWANPMAAWLLPALVLAIWRWFSRGKGWDLFIAVTILAAFWLTDSRSAFLLIGLVGLILAIANWRRWRKWIKIVFILVFSFWVTWLMTVARSQLLDQAAFLPGARFDEAVQGESTSGSDRLNYLRSTANIWRDNFWVGSGAGTFASLHPQYQQRVISAATHAHNFYLQSAAELGLIGIIWLAGLVLALLYQLWQTGKPTSKRRPDSFSAALALAAVLLWAHFALDIDSNFPPLVMLLAILLGMATQNSEFRIQNSDNGKKFASPGGFWFMAVILLGIPVYLQYQSRAQATYGQIAQDNGNFALAASYFKSAHSGLLYNPDTLTAEGINYLTLARQAIEPGRNLALAADRAQAAIKLDPRDSQHYFLLARVARTRQQSGPAETAYLQAISLDRLNHPEYYLDLAQLLLEQGRQPEAKFLLDTILELYPDEVVANRNADPTIPPTVGELYLARALIDRREGNTQQARFDVAAALRHNPGSETARALHHLLQNE